jgi:hypothetical protein
MHMYEHKYVRIYVHSMLLYVCFDLRALGESK